MKPLKLATLTVLIILAALLLIGCGSSDNGGTSDIPSDSIYPDGKQTAPTDNAPAFVPDIAPDLTERTVAEILLLGTWERRFADGHSGTITFNSDGTFIERGIRNAQHGEIVLAGTWDVNQISSQLEIEWLSVTCPQGETIDMGELWSNRLSLINTRAQMRNRTWFVSPTHLFLGDGIFTDTYTIYNRR